MADLPNENPGKPSLIPEPIRARLNDLAKKLESEHRSLEEANLLREAEVKGLQTELTRRESSLKNELSQLKGELTQKGSAQEEYKKKEQTWQKTQITWEAERKKWEAQTLQYGKELKRFQAELKNKGNQWRSEKTTLEQTVRKQEREILDLKNEHQSKLQQMEKEHQQRMAKEVDELEHYLNDARESWRAKKPEEK